MSDITLGYKKKLKKYKTTNLIIGVLLYAFSFEELIHCKL